MNNARINRIPGRYKKEVQLKLRVISEKLQQKRKALGWTQEELAERLDIATTTLQFIEQSRRFPSLPMLVYICVFLDIEIQLK